MNVVIRTDGGQDIGMGHVMRCIGLAHELKSRDATIRFAISRPENAVLDRISYEGFECLQIKAAAGSEVDAKETAHICKSLNADVLIADNYSFGENWFTTATVNGGIRSLLWTDYLQDKRLPVDILLDQTPGASANVYEQAAVDAKLLCGLEFAVLRPEFIGVKGIRHRRMHLHKVLVTMGGADPHNTTSRILQVLKKLEGKIQIRTVIGPANRFRQEIESVAEDMPGCEVFSAVTNMADMIAWADLAISAAGTSLWEFAYSGLPALVTSIADNQLPLAASIQDLGGGINLGSVGQLNDAILGSQIENLLISPEKLVAMSEAMLDIVDGGGASRVVDAIYELIKKQ